jgi:hypothetical protein
MKKLIVSRILLISFISTSCTNFSQNITIIDINSAYNYKGINKNYKIDKGKKKVVSYLASYNSLKDLLDKTPAGKIDKIITNNPHYEFVFYCDRVKLADTTKFKKLLQTHNCNFSVILDFDDLFYKENTDVLNPHGSGRLSKISLICNKNDRVLDCAVIGTNMSFFDRVFAKYR